MAFQNSSGSGQMSSAAVNQFKNQLHIVGESPTDSMPCSHSNNAATVVFTTDESAKPVPEQPTQSQNQQPIEMNTYIQLEMDNNNHACIPRVCRFRVARLTLNVEHSTVLVGIKLDASKRSIRTVDIPLRLEATSQKRELRHYTAELSLNYNIAYPHFLKKDANCIYFYVQKRKKLKNRTILGFKTIAFTAIDLSSILQKTFSNDLPLFNFDNKLPLILNSTNLQHLNHPDISQHIIGSLKLLGLCSMPLEGCELESAPHFSLNYSQMGKPNTENRDVNYTPLTENEESLLDDYELENAESDAAPKEDSDTPRCGFISESDVENEALKGLGQGKPKEDLKNPKKFTSKILSFIKKLRNENSTDELGLEQMGDEEYEEEYDYEFDSIEQVSDYDNSEASENNSNVDLYSIVSIPKPKLEPFFKNNSNPDLRSIGSNSLGLLNVKSVEREQHVSFNSSTPTNKKSLKKNRSSSLTSAYNTTEKCQSNVEGLKKQNAEAEAFSFFLVENPRLKSLIESNCKNDKSNFFIDFQSDMQSLLHLISRFDLTKSQLELIVVGTDQSFNSFLRFYAQLVNSEKVLNVFFIPFGSTSHLAQLLAKFSIVYCNFFTDHFWLGLQQCDLNDKCQQVISRICKYLEMGRQQYKKLTVQIGELTATGLAADRSVPFINEVKVEFGKGEESGKGVTPYVGKSILTNSSSLPQFFNTASTNSNSLLINAANPSIDSTSYMGSLEVSEAEPELQLDYWRMERVSGQTLAQANENYISDEYSAPLKDQPQRPDASTLTKDKMKKRSVSGHFQNIVIYRKPKNQVSKPNKNFDKFFQKELKSFQTSINCARGVGSSVDLAKYVEQEFLSLDYALLEKKPKMRLSTKKMASQKANHKEINKISNINLKQLDNNNNLSIKVDGVDIKNVRSIQISSNFESKCIKLHLIIP